LKVLIVGGGGREHAIAWKLSQSTQVTHILCIPGNGGTATMPKCQNLPLAVNDFEGIRRFAEVQGVSLTIVGPELPLANGIVDYFQEGGIPIFGPTKAAAQIEASKAWAKSLMTDAGIPTAQSAVFTDPGAAKNYVIAQGAPIVIKADGLASGKGVTVAGTVTEAIAAIDQILGGQFGQAGEKIVIEECLIGEELSVLAITDGLTIRPLLPARDYKRLQDGHLGPNTGGMGGYAPIPMATPELMAKIQAVILEPTMAALRDRGINYCGCLYAGLMITPKGEPQVIEFNSRFGDPETQVILPLLNTPLEDLMLACIEKRLDQMPPISWKPEASVCVILATRGYPEVATGGDIITGIKKAEDLGTAVFQAGTKIKNNTLVTTGGRTLGVTATANTLQEAIAIAYKAVPQIQYDGAYYRQDIGS